MMEEEFWRAGQFVTVGAQDVIVMTSVL